MSNRILPALRVFFEVGKALLNEMVYLVQSHHAVARALNGHGNERDVGVGRLDLGKSTLLL